ncbi:MAG: translation elongation factor 4 [bacterium]|nr:translation elongation factor 4 [bacterium]
MDQSRIRNFCIIAHIDHGKSTLADRLLEYTHTIPEREMSEQVLDSMDLEKERGITIKAHAISMKYRSLDGVEYLLNLIDTPGHVDFTYEVSRSLAACEGAILVVDASQGIEAQTLSNVYMAIDANLEIIPVVNKIDLPSADIQGVTQQIVDLLGCDTKDVIAVSGKTGQNVEILLETIVNRIPPPQGDPYAPLQAIIFDSMYDNYRGAIAYIRIVNGTLRKRDWILFMKTGAQYETEEIGTLRLGRFPCDELTPGMVGYLISGSKEVKETRVGDTVTHRFNPCSSALPGYHEPKPMVFAGVYPTNADDFQELRDSLEKLRLNDASLFVEPESSGILGFGFRCGFLGLLHMEIVIERLEREYHLDLITTVPSVEYKVYLTNGEMKIVDNPAHWPSPAQIQYTEEPYVSASTITPTEYIGAIMKLAMERRGIYKTTEYLSPERARLSFEFPLSEIVFDFYDRLKSITRGYASFDYEYKDYRMAKLVKLDIIINGDVVDGLSMIVFQDKAYEWGRRTVDKLKELIPRQLFVVAIQAAIGGKVIARATISALRKDVLAKCYGGDITRKRKLLEKQKEGKKRMKQIGSVEIPKEAFVAILKVDT